MKDHCDSILNAFYSCNTRQDTYIQANCNKIIKILEKSNLTFMELYLKCYTESNTKSHRILRNT